MKNRLLIFLLLVMPVNLFAQTDTLFWFAVPYATLSHDAPLTADLTLTATDLNNITTVTITQPYNPAILPITVTIDPAISLTQNINFNQATILNISSNLYNVKENSALLIRADHEITAYYEIHRTKNNPAIFTLKGKNALGYDFWTPFQEQWPNHDWDAPDDRAFSQIIIVATEDNTIVTFRFKRDAFGYLANTNYTVTLDKGQTYMFVPKSDPTDGGDPSVKPGDRLTGTHITSNKPIAVTLGDDSVEKGGYDYMGDQHIPIKNVQNKAVIGYEYIVMKGKVSDQAGGSNEKSYVLVTKNNTSITVTRRSGVVTTFGPYAAGFQLPIDLLAANNDYYVHIKATEPVYVLHIAGFGTELGESILPTIDGCTGSLTVSFVRSKNQDFYLNLMTKADAIDSFYISINNGPAVHFLNASMFEQAGTSGWYVLKDINKLISNAVIPTGAVTRIFNTKNVFHLGYFNGVTVGGGCVYGYFSDYNELEATATVENQGSVFQVCGVDSIELKAKGGISYHWSPTEYLSDPNIQNPILRPPPGGFSQVFAVDIEQPCFGFTTKYVWVIIPDDPNGFIAVNRDQGCSQLTIDLNDASHGATSYILDLGDGSPLIVSPNPINLTHSYKNNTNAIIDYFVSYTVSNDEGCNDFYQDTIRVFPQVNASFELLNPNDTAVCHSTTLGLRSTSTGNTESYQWDFGDGSSSTDTLVLHEFSNFGINDTVYHVSMTAISPYSCYDTSDIVDIRIFPYIYSSFTVDSAVSCSPVKLFINPISSVGVDTFHWSLYDVNKAFFDSSFIKLNESPVKYTHYNTTRPYPDTLMISMHSINRFGCRDTATNKEIIVYPEVNANFTIDKNIICDSVGVLFSNNSSGYRVLYDWDFDNGTSKSDTSMLPFTRYFYNRSGVDTTYKIILTATSDYYCKDTSSAFIKVYPFIKASFSIDYANNCSPIHAQIVNNSKGGSSFNWEYGDNTSAVTFAPDTLFHVFENNTDNDTTFFIRMRAENLQGCTDSIQRSVFLFPRVISNFSFDSPNQGCNPLNVSFLNNSKGKNLDYIWDFGDKTYSTSQNPPPRVYKNSTDKDTTYYVNLTVMNLAGCDSSITREVEVYSKVTADFAIERLDSCSPFKIIVNNFSSGGIADFIWKYTEDDSITLLDFSNPDIPVYRNQTLLPIRHPIVLRTRNIQGCSASKNDTVTVFPEMHADFHPELTAGCQPLPVEFANNSNIISGTSFVWNFGDGKFSNLATPPEHIYSNLTGAIKPNNVLLEAITQYGCFDDTAVTVNVYPYIYAKFGIDRPSICANELFTIDRNSSAGAINHYYWDYQNDGTVDEDKTNPVFTYTYSNTGIADLNPKIRLTVTNAQGCDTSWTETIAVHPQVRAAFNVDNEEACYPLPTSFNNLTEPAIPLTYYWDFGDGSSSVNKNPVHGYKNFSRTNDQSFPIFLTATSEYGCDSTVSGMVTIHPKPMADFTYPMTVDCPPFSVPFTNNSMGTSLDYNWDFNNGNTSTEMNPVQTFNNTGSAIVENPITLIVNTDFNCADTAVKPVQVYPGVEVDFDASDWNGCNPMQINLNGTATNENEFYWSIDGKIFSNYEDPSYRFVNETVSDKVFNVKFKAISINGCTSDIVKQITIYPKPLAEFLPSPQALDFNTETDITFVTLNNLTNTQAIWGYHWDFGDGTTSEQSSASFVKDYTIWGDINNESRIPVSLIATNLNHTACADTVLHFVIIKPPLPKVDLGPNMSGCMPLIVEFPAATKYNYPDSYQWDFGFEGQISTDDEPAPLIYDTAGVYIVRLLVQGDGGSNWDYKTITVYPKPIADFSFTPDYAWLGSQNEAGTPIKFFNTTRQGVSYIWQFGDTEVSNEFQPQHEYLKVGTFYVTLIAESGEGCMDTLVHETPIIIEGRGRLNFPNVITIVPGDAADENYDPGEANPRIFRPDAEGVEKYKLEIYNRWGELIFVSDDVNKGWNGFIKGSPVKQDVYVWRVTAMFTNGRPYVKAGDVTVLVKQP
jgi:PKD repeat protein